MRDGVFLKRLGHPVVVFVHDDFERAARAQASALHTSDLRIFVYPQPKLGDSVSGEAEKAIQAVKDFPKLLEGGN